MIEQVRIANFKAIGSSGVHIVLAPLTIFVGPNGAGKSSVLEGIGLLAQSARPSNRIGLITEGRLVALGEDFTALYHDRVTSQALQLGLTWRDSSKTPEISCSLSVRDAQRSHSGDWRQSLHSGESGIDFFKEPVGEGGGYRLIAELSGGTSGRFWVGGNPDRFLDEQLFAIQGPNPPNATQAALLTPWKQAADSIAGFLSSTRLRYLSALRGGRLMEEEQKGEAATAGVHGLNTVRLLSRIKATGTKDKRDRLERLAARFGMPDLTAGYSGEGLLRAEFEAEAAPNTRLPVFFAGFGSQHALPVIADFVDAASGTTILVEEIEHSSHPQWVRQWGQTLGEVVSDWGLQVVTTTHAPTLVLAVALAVRKRLLRPDQVAIYEFTLRKGAVTTQRLEFDESGKLDRGWISTFAQTESELLDELLPDAERATPTRS